MLLFDQQSREGPYSLNNRAAFLLISLEKNNFLPHFTNTFFYSNPFPTSCFLSSHFTADCHSLRIIADLSMERVLKKEREKPTEKFTSPVLSRIIGVLFLLIREIYSTNTCLSAEIKERTRHFAVDGLLS